MASTEQPGFFVHVADGAEIAPQDLKVRILADVVLGHLEHAEMEVRDGAEGTTCDENDRDFVGVLEGPGETVAGKLIVGGICEGFGEMRGGHGGREGEGGWEGRAVVGGNQRRLLARWD